MLLGSWVHCGEWCVIVCVFLPVVVCFLCCNFFQVEWIFHASYSKKKKKKSSKLLNRGGQMTDTTKLKVLDLPGNGWIPFGEFSTKWKSLGWSFTSPFSAFLDLIKINGEIKIKMNMKRKPQKAPIPLTLCLLLYSSIHSGTGAQPLLCIRHIVFVFFFCSTVVFFFSPRLIQ